MLVITKTPQQLTRAKHMPIKRGRSMFAVVYTDTKIQQSGETVFRGDLQNCNRFLAENKHFYA